MDFVGFELFPLEGRTVDVADQQAVGRALEDARVLACIPRGRQVTVEVGRQIATGLTPAAAHGEWRESYFPSVETLPGLPRQPLDAKTPAGLVHCHTMILG